MLTGLLLYWLVLKIGLPAVARRLTPAQVDWLRNLFRVHPAAVLAVVGGSAVLLASPVLVVFRLVSGPLQGRRPARRRS